MLDRRTIRLPVKAFSGPVDQHAEFFITMDTSKTVLSIRLVLALWRPPAQTG
jgi:hypothetical protein